METNEKLKEIISKQLDLDENYNLTFQTDFSQIGLDSLDIVDLMMTVEDEFDIEIPDEELEKMNCIDDVAEYIDSII